MVGYLLAGIAIAIRLMMLLWTHSTTEDALITLRYAENIAHGNGFVYNSGQHVLGTTTPLYTLVLALFEFLHLNALAAGKFLNIAADGITVYLISDILLRLGRPRSGWIAALLYATASTSVNISIGGMETGLVTLFCTLAIAFYMKQNNDGLFASLAILFLLRIDGLLLGVILLAAVFYRDKRLPIRSALLALGIVLPWLIFTTVYFGSPIPASMVAKLTVYNRLITENLPNLSTFRTQFYAGPVQVVTTLLFVVGLITVIRKERSLVFAAGWLILYFGVMFVSKVPAFGWYFLPPLPIYYVLVGIGISSLFPQSSRSKMNFRVSSVALLILGIPLVYHGKSIARDITNAQNLEDGVRRPIGEWLAGHNKEGDTVLLEPIGYIGYYSKLNVIDMVGLVSPEVLPYYRTQYQNPLGEMVDKFRPSYLVLRESEVNRLSIYVTKAGRNLLEQNYTPLRNESLHKAGNEFRIYKHKETNTNDLLPLKK